MQYVLIVLLWGGNNTQSMGMHDFNTLEQCRYAALTIRQADGHVTAAYCVEKGKAP